MQFTHEANVSVVARPGDLLPHWADAFALPRQLTHVRAVAPGEGDDLARFVIMLAERHIEFAAQRTMCTEQTICWQSVGPSFLYVLTVGIKPACERTTALTVTVAYDPPGFLPDIVESIGLKKQFRQMLETDLRRYAQYLTPSIAVLADRNA
jgi:uncharacterized membrane protein